MRTALSIFARTLGFTKPCDSVSESEVEENAYWGIDNPKEQLLREQLEYYFSDVNLERDVNFREEIAKNSDRYVSVDYLMRCNRVKQMKATPEEVLAAAGGSTYIEADMIRRAVRSQKEFVSDPQRSQRTLRVTGFAADVPQFSQIEFFKSIFPKDDLRVTLLRKQEGEEFVYTGVSLLELETIESANLALERGIEYGKGTLGLVRLSDYEAQLKHQKGNKKNRTPKKANA